MSDAERCVRINDTDGAEATYRMLDNFCSGLPGSELHLAEAYTLDLENMTKEDIEEVLREQALKGRRY